jgi:hypothetical protein
MPIPFTYRDKIERRAALVANYQDARRVIRARSLDPEEKC